MPSVLELFKSTEFRQTLEKAIKNHSDDFSLPGKIPRLFKYCGFSQHAVKNLLTDGLSLSIIASFNDCYDSNISFGNIAAHAQSEYIKDKKLFNFVGYEPCITIDEWTAHINTAQEAYRGFCNDSHCMCLSEINNSTLMWSHYADCNRGICIEYDFETIKANPLYYALFPVCYTQVPIDVYDFVHEYNGDTSIEIGVLISVLNKALCWRYEKEWRLIILNEILGNRQVDKYLTLSNIIQPKSIIIGQNFLDNFIPELNREGKVGAVNAYNNLKNMIAVLKSKNIQVSQITSIQNSYLQTPCIPLDLDFLQNFIDEYNELDYFTLQNRNYLHLSYWEELKEIL